jgi:hypothetical protein
LYETALTHYREQHWELAQQLLLQLREQSPERLLYSIYLERIDYFNHNPPRRRLGWGLYFYDKIACMDDYGCCMIEI